MLIFDTSSRLLNLIGYNLKLKSKPVKMRSSMELPIFKTNGHTFDVKGVKKGLSLFLPFVAPGEDTNDFLINTGVFPVEGGALPTLPPGVICRPYGVCYHFSLLDRGRFLQRCSEAGLNYFTTYVRDTTKEVDDLAAINSALMIFTNDFSKVRGCPWTSLNGKAIETGKEKWSEEMINQKQADEGFVFDAEEHSIVPVSFAINHPLKK